jgi:hypothetical protein
MGTRRLLYCDNCGGEDDVMPKRVTDDGKVIGPMDLCAPCRAKLVDEPLAGLRAVAAKLAKAAEGPTIDLDTPAPRDVRAYYKHVGEPLAPREKLTEPVLTRYRDAVKAGEWPPEK